MNTLRASNHCVEEKFQSHSQSITRLSSMREQVEPDTYNCGLSGISPNIFFLPPSFRKHHKQSNFSKKPQLDTSNKRNVKPLDRDIW